MADDLMRFQRVLHVREVERELTQIELTDFRRAYAFTRQAPDVR